MKKIKYIPFFLFGLFILLWACRKDPNINPIPGFTTTPYTFPDYSPLPFMKIPSSNPTTVEGVLLGKYLYYDTLLHPQGQFACASCHFQNAGFTTPGKNVLPHANLGWNSYFLWDGSIGNTLEDAMLFEVNDFFKSNVKRLYNRPVYSSLFKKAFGDSIITPEKCAKALAQFQRSLISFNSPFDRYLRRKAVLTPDQFQGFVIFNSEKGDCFHCHSLPLMTDGQLHNDGIDSFFDNKNSGYYNHSGDKSDIGKYKTPSLRNVALRNSYMHDGRYKTLDEVIEHYNSGMKYSETLDPIFTKPGRTMNLKLTPVEKKQLKAFLETLTDSTYNYNPEHASPF